MVAQARELTAIVLIEAHPIAAPLAGKSNHHRLQHPPCTTVDGLDDTAARGCESNARVLLVGEKRLSELDAVAFLNLHGGLQIHIVRPQQSDTADRCAGRHRLFGCACNREVEASFCPYQHGLRRVGAEMEAGF